MPDFTVSYDQEYDYIECEWDAHHSWRITIYENTLHWFNSWSGEDWDSGDVDGEFQGILNEAREGTLNITAILRQIWDLTDCPVYFKEDK